jgi:hypothetical protein
MHSETTGTLAASSFLTRAPLKGALVDAFAGIDRVRFVLSPR